jgi:hypothetical protein
MEWHIHLGAHKTATTHFQDLLQENSSALAEAGTLFVPRCELRSRKINTRIVRGELNRDLLCALQSGPSELRPSAAGICKVLLSEENILGTSADLLEVPLYPRAESRLRAWANILRGEDVRLYLTIRNFADILPSAYSQATRQGQALPAFEMYAQNTPSWVELTKRINRVFPTAPLTIWTFESYVQKPAAYLSHLNVGEIRVKDLSVPGSTRSLSAKTLDRMQWVNSLKVPKLFRKKLGSVLAGLDEGVGFKPLGAAHADGFVRSYFEELQALESLIVDPS